MARCIRGTLVRWVAHSDGVCDMRSLLFFVILWLTFCFSTFMCIFIFIFITATIHIWAIISFATFFYVSIFLVHLKELGINRNVCFELIWYTTCHELICTLLLFIILVNLTSEFTLQIFFLLNSMFGSYYIQTLKRTSRLLLRKDVTYLLTSWHTL